MIRVEKEQCCGNTPAYEVSYHHIPRKWFVCFHCMDLECFNSGIKEKVRIQYEMV